MNNYLPRAVYWLSLFSFAGAAVFCLYYFLGDTGFLNSKPVLSRTEPSQWCLREWMRKLIKRLPLNWFKGQQRLLPEIMWITTIVCASRLLIVCIGYLAPILLRNGNGDFFDSLKWLWIQWDASNYVKIAQHGYVNNLTDERYYIAFLPFYPFMIRLVATLTRNFELAGLVVSNFSLIVSGIILYRLVKIDFGPKTARYAVTLFTFAPFSFFLGTTYSDSLFVTLSLLTFYFLRKTAWSSAALCGFLASFTRNFGVLLVVPALIEFLIATGLFQKIKHQKFEEVIAHLKSGWVLPGIPLGYGVYLLINKLVTGDWFKFAVYQREHWSNRFGFFPANLANYAGYALNDEPSVRIAIWIPGLVSVGFGLLLLFYGFRKVRLSYLVYMLLYLYICVSATWLLSGARYVMGLFPVYILLALLTRGKTTKIITIALSVALLTFYTAAFVLYYQVM